MLSTTSRDVSASNQKKVEHMSNETSKDIHSLDLEVPQIEHIDSLASKRLADTILKQWTDKIQGYDPQEVLVVLGSLRPEDFLDATKSEDAVFKAFFKGPLEILDCSSGMITEEAADEKSPVGLVLEKILEETRCPHSLAISVLTRPENDPMWNTIQGMVKNVAA